MYMHTQAKYSLLFIKIIQRTINKCVNWEPSPSLIACPQHLSPWKARWWVHRCSESDQHDVGIRYHFMGSTAKAIVFIYSPWNVFLTLRSILWTLSLFLFAQNQWMSFVCGFLVVVSWGLGRGLVELKAKKKTKHQRVVMHTHWLTTMGATHHILFITKCSWTNRRTAWQPSFRATGKSS